MDQLINKLKEGNRFCSHTLSPDCLILANKNKFIGTFCVPCFKEHTKTYYAEYNKKHYKKRIKQKEIKAEAKEKNNNIMAFLENMKDDDLFII